MNLNPFNNTDNRQHIVNAGNSKNENRTALVASIADLKSERADKIKPLTSDLQIATTAVEQAQQALILAQAKQHTADSKLRQVSGSYSHQISRVEARLLACVPDSINEIITQLRSEQSAIRNKSLPAHTASFTRAAIARSKARADLIQTMNERREDLRAGITEAEGLRLSSAEDIADGLQTIRETLNLPPVTRQ